MQSVSARIWTRVAVSISFDDNHYTTGTFWDNKSQMIWLNGNEEVLRIPQSSRTGTMPSDSLLSYPGHSFGSYPTAKMQSVYTIASADWTQKSLDHIE